MTRAPSGPRMPEDAVRQLDGLIQQIRTPGADRVRSVALASAQRGEGTSSCAFVLAVHLATQHDARVILVDGNLRQPSLHKLCRQRREPGLSELLNDGATLEGMLKSTELPNLAVVTAGGPLPNASHALAKGGLGSLLDRLSADCDLVIVDCAAVNAYPDAMTLAAHCDASILVVRAGRTRREVAAEAKERLAGAKDNLLGVLLNRRRYYIPESLYQWL